MFTKEEVDKIFVEMLKSDDSIERFMLCTPFTTDDILKYGGDLTEDLFYEKLYVRPRSGEYKTIETKIIRGIKSHNKNTIYILGNKGCGKSTFINKIRRTLKTDSDICYEFIDFGESNATLKYKKTKETLVRKIYKILKTLFKEERDNRTIKRFIQFYFDNIEDIDSEWDAEKNIDLFFKTLKGLIQESNTKLEQLEVKIRPILLKTELFQLFFILTLLLMHIQLIRYSYLKPTAIILDNLDNMLEITEIKTFIEHYRNYLQLIGTFIKRCNWSDGKQHRYRFVYILVMREITKANISTPHSLEVSRVSSREYDVTELFPKKDISHRRTKYLLELIELIEKKEILVEEWFQDILPDLKRQAETIQIMVGDSYIQKTIYPLFNNDYRIATMTLVKMCIENATLLQEYIELFKCGISSAKYGGRGIVYRLVLDRFKERKYFKKIGLVDFKDRSDKKVSLNRLILTYLNNTTDIKATGDSKAISLKEIFRSFKMFKSKEVVECLWEMYNLITTEEWNPLIMFASSLDVSKDGLFLERKRYRESLKEDEDIDTEAKYSFLRITCAGRVYLTNICTHFEFFSCRIFGKKRPPLFSKRVFVLKNDEPIFKTIIDAVYEEVKLCCKSLEEFEGVGGVCSKIDSDFNYKNEYGVYQYHGERIIFSHISYIDIYRCYLLAEKPKEICAMGIELKDISRYLIEMCEKYLELFEVCKIGSSIKNKEGAFIKDIMKDKVQSAYDNPCDFTCTINIQEDDQ
ncbi:MAG: hypothetical protein HFG22_14260 [Lachnospiraceae bacterium]|nr:hypothetical protein [Lachnospiraceae bacterium]